MKSESPYLTARQAAWALRVSLPTLYSYVSRRMLRSEPVAGQPRLRRYPREDVARLAERKEIRKNPAMAAAQGLHWGNPVLESALTLISEGKLFYRGVDALSLAQNATVEEVAALLWTGDAHQASHLLAGKTRNWPSWWAGWLKRSAHLGPVERCQLALPLAAAGDLAAYDLRPAAVAKTGANILRLLLCAVCGGATEGPMEDALAQKWTPSRKSNAAALRAALILCADHELNVSAFTARCIASARATPYEVVLGGLAALRGARHGGAAEQVEAVFHEAEQSHQPEKVLAGRLRSSGALPGFGHPLYPNGDPRASFLLSVARTSGRGAAIELADGLMRAAQKLTGEHSNLDFSLVALARALNLPDEAPIALFALGRTIGWIAHAIEQYGNAQLIRPRARYIGPIPTEA